MAKLSEAASKLPSAEAQLAAKEEAAGEAGQDSSAAKAVKVVTPLMQHIIDRHEQRLNRRAGARGSSMRSSEPKGNASGQVQIQTSAGAHACSMYDMAQTMQAGGRAACSFGIIHAMQKSASQRCKHYTYHKLSENTCYLLRLGWHAMCIQWPCLAGDHNSLPTG